MSPHQLTLLQGSLRRSLHEQNRESKEPAFSLMRTLKAIAERRTLDGFEGEVLREASDLAGSGSIYAGTQVLPFAILDHLATRDLNVTTTTAGGNMVATSKPEALVAFDGSVTSQAGVTLRPGQKDNVSIPVTTGTLPVTWLQLETSAAGEQTPTTGIASAAPKTASVTVDLSDRLIRQGALAEPYVAALLLQAARSALDVAVFGGTGTLGQPLGLLNNTAITSQSGTAFNLATRCAIQKAVADNLVSDTTARWVGATDVRQTLAQRAAFASTASPLWDNDSMGGRLALAAGRMTAGGLLYGDFSEVQALLWGGGIEIASDIYSQFTTGVVTFRVLLTCDVIVPRPGALIRVPAVT